MNGSYGEELGQEVGDDVVGDEKPVLGDADEKVVLGDMDERAVISILSNGRKVDRGFAG